MVTSTIVNNQPYFSTELDLVQVQVSEMKLTGIVILVSVGEATILENGYYLVDDKASIYDMGKLIEHYIPIPAIGENLADSYKLAPAAASLKFKLLGVELPLTVNNNVYYARCMANFSTQSKLLLTERESIRTKSNRPEYVSFIYQQGLKANIGVAHLVSGKARYKRFDLPLPAGLSNEIVSESVSMQRIAKLASIDINAMLYYDVMLMEDAKIVDKLRFTCDTRSYREENTLVYYNAFGVPSTMTFTGLTEYAPELSGSTAVLLDSWLRPGASIEDVRTLNTGYLSPGDYRELLQLTTSPQLWMYEQGRLEPVFIDEIDYTHKNIQNEKVNVRLTIRKTAKRHHRFERVPAVRQRIFDKSFDISFE